MRVGNDGNYGAWTSNLKREIPTGTLRAMIEQLGLDPIEFGLNYHLAPA